MTRAADDLGKITLSPSGELTVGTVHIFRFVYTAGKRGIAPGGGIRIFFPGAHSWTKAQVFKAAHRGGYIEALADDGRCLVRTYNMARGYSNDFGKLIGDAEYHAVPLPGNYNAIQVEVEKGHLRPGGKIRVTYGALRYGAGFGVLVGHRVIQCRENPDAFPVSVDTDGSGKYLPLPRRPEVKLVPDEPRRLEIVLKAHPREDRCTLRVRVNDRFHNAVPSCRGNLEVASPGKKLRKRVDTGRRGVVVLRERLPRGKKTLRVKASLDGEVSGTSNPLPPEDALEGYQLLWGDIHHHTCYSDDNRLVTVMPATPEETCSYARDVAGLDFVAITDHHNWHKKHFRRLIRQAWDAANDCAARLCRPGEFVVFPGMEYRCDRGDTNILFPAPGAPYCPPRIDAIQKVWRFYEGRDFFSIPHHHADEGTSRQWRHRNDDEERLVEICSGHGRYEYYGNTPLHPRRMRKRFHNVQYLLNQGRRMGIVASSDNHTGHPGDSQLAAVYARGCTVEDIWDALRSRRCYGTTHARIAVDFRVQGAWMGSELRLAAGTPRKLTLRVRGTAPVLAAELIRNGRVLRAEYNCGRDLRLSFDDKNPGRRTDYYYARLLQEDNEMAWTSPVWVTRA